MKSDSVPVKAIHKLSILRPKKDIQSFLGKINFVRRLIPKFSKLVKHINSMLRKEAEIKCTENARNSFEAIKKAIMEAPNLFSPDYTKSFYIFSFSSYDTVAAIFLQKDEEGPELKYDPIEKQAYAIIKSLKAFRIYILHIKVIAYIPSAYVKDVLTHLKLMGREPNRLQS